MEPEVVPVNKKLESDFEKHKVVFFVWEQNEDMALSLAEDIVYKYFKHGYNYVGNKNPTVTIEEADKAEDSSKERARNADTSSRVLIKGRLSGLSKEELRAMVYATMTVCEFHNKRLAGGDDITVLIVKPHTLGKSKMNNENIVGIARTSKRIIEIADYTEDRNRLFTVVMHEVIHLYFNLDDDQTEYATCKLVNRLAPTIVELYGLLMDGLYQRAGYIAHCKISYYPEGKDRYDDCQWDVPEPPVVPSLREQKEQEKRMHQKAIEENIFDGMFNTSGVA